MSKGRAYNGFFEGRRSSNVKEAKIVFIGPGMMAEAMVAGLLREGLAEPQNLLVAGPRPDRLDSLRERYGVQSESDNRAAASQADVLALTVKPQTLPGVLAGLQGALPPEALTLSVVAGATLANIAAALGCEAVVRAMPNTPARIGQGITVWTAAEAVSPAQRQQARAILTALGQEVYMEDESFLDKATALSGTGPAYVYLFMEAMVDAGVHLGFPRRIAEQLVIQTLRGSVEFYDRDDDHRHLARLRNQVTSPGGTSAEAIYYLEKAGFRTAISRAVWAAYERSVALGGGHGERRPPK